MLRKSESPVVQYTWRLRLPCGGLLVSPPMASMTFVPLLSAMFGSLSSLPAVTPKDFMEVYTATNLLRLANASIQKPIIYICPKWIG